MPSCVMPRWTGTPSFLGTLLVNLIVLFGSAQMASPRSLPTFVLLTSKAHVNSMSLTW